MAIPATIILSYISSKRFGSVPNLLAASISATEFGRRLRADPGVLPEHPQCVSACSRTVVGGVMVGLVREDEQVPRVFLALPVDTAQDRIGEPLEPLRSAVRG